MRTTFSRISAMTDAQRGALVDQFDKASRISGAEPIAVVGIGCRFPGGVVGPDDYWSLLAGGRDAITEVPADRWDAEEYYDPDPLAPGRMPSKWGGFISDVSGFDADFFGITPREAEAMDPQQRVLLEVAWEALEHAGMAPDSLGGSRTGVMMGVYYNEYQSASAANPDTIDAYSATGNAHSVTVGRIAYLLGLRGPAVAVDTACSSSLVSVHLACQSLRMRESDLVLAGGVNLILRPETQLALAKWGMLSPRGRCHAFDAGADGFVRGEGAGVVVLKRLTDAVRDGDRVLAVVRGSAVNQDGRSNGLTAPNAPAQRDVITQALSSGDVSAASVSFVETHGTGTALGDPIEFDALAAVYGRGDAPCALGAVKTNFGHLEAAAGIAGFIKTVLSVQRGMIPPNLHFSQWNPAIDAKSTRLRVPTELAAWPDAATPRRAGVSSFGLGGTNAHIVLEQGPEAESAAAEDVGPVVTTLAVSGKSEARLARWAARLADWLEVDGADVPLPQVAHTLRRRRNGVTAAVCARDRAEAVAGLRAVAAGQPAPGVLSPRDVSCGPGTVFLYSGQGSQWAGMGRRLLAEEPAFAAAVADLEPDFVAQAGFSLQQVLSSGEEVVGIDRIQPVLVGVQLALTALWRSYGVEPDAVIGHSMGEVTAAVVAGALTPADGLKVISTRSRLMARLSGQGAMALLESDAPATEALIANYPDVTLAVHASPRQTVIAGPPDQVDAIIAEMQNRNKLARRVVVDVASHHPTVDPILPELRSALSGLTPGPPRIPLFSTADPSGGTPVMDSEYWVNNLRNPVRFSQAVAAAAEGHASFIEMSPHPLLTHAIVDGLAVARPRGDVQVLGTVTRDDDETLAFHVNLAAATSARGGVAATPEHSGSLTDIPPSPWQHSPYWMASRPGAGTPKGEHPLLGTHVEMPSGEHIWQADVGTDSIPWLADHMVHGQPIMPAAAFTEMALAAGTAALGLPVERVIVSRVEVEQMLPVGGAVRLTTQLTSADDGGMRVEIHSRRDGGAWTRHAVARVEPASQDVTPVRPAPLGESGATVSPGDFYTALRRTGAHHGQAFAALTRIVRTAGGASDVEIVLPDEATPNRAFRLHPVMLDAALQGLAAAMPAESLAGSADATILPVSIESVRVFGDVGRRARCRAELVNLDDEGAGKLGKLTLLDDAGTPTAEITGVYLRRVQRRMVPLPLEQKLFDTSWVEAPEPREAETVGAALDGSWLVLGDDTETRDLAAEFATRFGTPTRRVVTADLADESAVVEAFAKAAADPELSPVGVIALVGKRTFDGTDSDGALAHACDLIWSASVTVRTVAGGWHGTSPRLWLVTRDGLPVSDGEAGNPAAGGLKGLVRVLAYEHPELRATLVDIGTVDSGARADLDDNGDGVVATVMSELGAPGRDDVVAWRDGRRYVERLSRATLGARRQDPVVRRGGSYILTGGLGGLGLVMADWLAERGAGRVVLNGRSEPSEAARQDLADLQNKAEIIYVAGDIAASGVAERLVAVAEEGGRTLSGILHSAAVIDDGLVSALSRESLDSVWAPKAAGALRLHEATVARDLDWWVGFSSVASLLGSPGQGAYAASNAWLDGLVAWRRASGLPATAINWGQWSDVGVAQSLSMDALDPITPAEGIEALESVLSSNVGQVGVARLRLDRAAAAFPEISELGFFATLVEELGTANDGGDWPGPDAIREMDPTQAAEVVTARLRSRIAAIMGYAGDSAIDTSQALTTMGMDSLMAVRIRNTVRGDFGVEPPVALLLQGATVEDLAADLIRQLGIAASGEDTESPGGLRDRAQQRAAARQRAALRRKTGQRA